jgi:peroxiredoxin
VAFQKASTGAFYFRAELTPSPTPPLPGRETTLWGAPRLTIASNGREVTARDEAIGRFSYGSYSGGSGHLAASSGYAVLFEFAEDEPFAAELSGELIDLGREIVGGVECHVIGTTSPAFGGAEVIWHIGVEDGLPRGRRWVATQPGAEGEFSFRISDLVVDKALGSEALGNTSESDDELIEEDARIVDVGSPAPSWTLADASGANLSLEELRGEVVVLAVWATWCLPCQDVLSAVDGVVRRFDGEPVRLIGISAWEDPDVSATRVMAARGLSYEVLEHGELVGLDYKVAAPPALFVIDTEGRLVFVRNPLARPLDDLAADVETAIRAALP